MTTVSETPNDPPTLSEPEAAELAAHEAVIGAGLDTFQQVGRALLSVRVGKLYRATHNTFTDYCADRWGMSDRQGRRLMAAATVADLAGPTGPVSERVARELTPLREDPALLAKVWAEAQRLAGDGTVTADHVVTARENAVVRTVATRRPSVIADAVERAPGAAVALAASPAVRREVESGDRATGDRIKAREKAKRELPDSPLVVRIELLVAIEEVYRHTRKTLDLIRNGALERASVEVQEELTATCRRAMDMLAFAAELGEFGAKATDEALHKLLDQSGDQP